MTHGSLFSGIGGFDLASEWMGWENIFHCEWEEFPRRILKYYWPNAISYGDIKKTDFTIHRGRIDILTGGFPCQPYSTAGKRKGKEDERHLWPEMLRAVREAAPTWVVGENVRGLINWNGGMVFDEVQADLEALGYEVLPFLLPAAGVNAPHRRERIWFVAFNPECTTHVGSDSGKGKTNGVEMERDVLDTPGRKQSTNNAEPSGEYGTVADTENIGQKPTGNSRKGGAGFTYNDCDTNRIFANSDSIIGCKGWVYEKGQEKAERYACSYNTRPNWENWKNFPTQPPVCTGDDGFSSELLRQFIREDTQGLLTEKEIDKILSEANSKWRKEVIKAGGNAVVPQVPYQIFKAIEQYEKQNK